MFLPAMFTSLLPEHVPQARAEKQEQARVAEARASQLAAEKVEAARLAADDAEAAHAEANK